MILNRKKRSGVAFNWELRFLFAQNLELSMMKKVLILAVLALSIGASAQKSKVTSTYNYLKYGELDNAKEAIDAATANEATSGWYKTWMYRAQTYSQLARSTDPKYASLKNGALEEAIAAYKKLLTIEDKKNDKNKMKQEYASLVSVAYSTGLDAYDAKDFATTYKFWVLADNINDEIGNTDTALVYNIALPANGRHCALQVYRLCSWRVPVDLRTDHLG